MTFCKEMSRRVEEPFCKNIWFLNIDTNYCSDLYMFLIRLNHLPHLCVWHCVGGNAGKSLCLPEGSEGIPEVVWVTRAGTCYHVDSDCYLQKGGKLLQLDTACVHFKKKRNPYKKDAWKSTRPGKKEAGNQKLLPYCLTDTQTCYLLSKITTSYKKVIGMMQHSHHEESCHLTKWWDFRVECWC